MKSNRKKEVHITVHAMQEAGSKHMVITTLDILTSVCQRLKSSRTEGEITVDDKEQMNQLMRETSDAFEEIVCYLLENNIEQVGLINGTGFEQKILADKLGGEGKCCILLEEWQFTLVATLVMQLGEIHQVVEL